MTKAGPAMEMPQDASAEDRRALLRSLLARDGQASRPQAPGPGQGDAHSFPLTEIQRAYWLGRNPEFPLGGVGIHGYFEMDCTDLDLERLEAAWNQTIARHDMMRCMVQPDGMVRILAEVAPYRIAFEDLSALSEVQRQARVQELRKRMSHQVFDPAHWPLFEIRACRMGGQTTRLFFSEDAIHMDLVSSEIVARDWACFYKGVALPPPPELTFREVVLGQNAARPDVPILGRQDAAQDWPEPPNIPGPPDGAPPEMRFTRRSLRLDPATWRDFCTQATRCGLTPSDALLAIYADVLRAWSTTPRFMLNVTLQNRPSEPPEIAQIVGDFTNFILVDIDLSVSAGFAERAARHRDALWSAFEDPNRHGVDALRRMGQSNGQSGGTTPSLAPFVYTSALGTQGYRALEAFGEVVFEVTQTPQVLIDQQVLVQDGALHLSWDSVDSAFAPGVAAAMFDALQRRCQDLAQDPAAWQSKSAIPLPPDQAERRARMNATDAPIRQGRLEEIFVDTAQAFPKRVALIEGQTAMRFGDLLKASRGLASALSWTLQGRPPGPVLIWLPKGIDQIVSVLAVLLCGRPYLAMDPHTPAERLRAALDLTGTVAAIATPQSGLPDLPTVDAVDILSPKARAEGPFRPKQTPSDIAYILFTSGSTGTPKGIPIRHSSVINRMDDMRARFGLAHSDKAIAISALHHDLSVFDIFGVMACTGGAMVFPTHTGVGDPAEWLDLISRHKVTLWNTVPAFLEMLLALPQFSMQAGTQPDLDTLRHVFLSGDLVPTWLPDKLRNSAGNARVHALGGPTETTVWDIGCADADCPEGWHSVPYGVPLANGGYHIRHADGSDCPEWVAGHLCLSGAGLSAGYIGGDPKDRARFVQDRATGAPLFWSGDLGRARPDGQIEFLGRSDRMVKLRGHRVELAEVEAALRARPEVGLAVAFVIPAADGTKRLAAAVTPRDGAPGADPVPEIALPAPDPDLLLPRASRETALAFSARPLAYKDVAQFLATFCALPRPDGRPHRLHPSASGAYSVEIDVMVHPGSVIGLASGLYRLDPDRHCLDRRSDLDRLPPQAHADRNQPLARTSALTLLLSYDPDGLVEAYGARGRDLALLEAGYIGQLAQTAAAGLGLASCPLGGLDLHSGVLPSGRVLLHALLIGGAPGSPSVSNGWTSSQARSLSQGIEAALRPQARPAPLLLLDKLPLTSNGKPDIATLIRRAAAQTTGAPQAIEDGESDAPKAAALSASALQALETALAEIIGTKNFPRSSGFAELGVFSVDLVRLHARLRDAGFQLTLPDLFNTPTVAALAQRLAGGDGTSDAAFGTARGTLRRDRLMAAKERK